MTLSLKHKSPNIPTYYFLLHLQFITFYHLLNSNLYLLQNHLLFIVIRISFSIQVYSSRSRPSPVLSFRCRLCRNSSRLLSFPLTHFLPSSFFLRVLVGTVIFSLLFIVLLSLEISVFLPSLFFSISFVCYAIATQPLVKISYIRFLFRTLYERQIHSKISGSFSLALS